MTTLAWVGVDHDTGAMRQRRSAVLRGGLLGLLLLVAATVRFGGLDRESRHGDEYHQTMAYGLAPQYVALWSRTEGQPPLDALIGWAVAKASHSLWAMRAPAALFGAASVGLCFAVVRRTSRSWRAGFVAAGIVALSPLHWKMSQTARPYTIFIAALLLMLWALLAALEQPDRRRLVAYAVAAYVMTLTRSLGPLAVLTATGIAVCAVLATLPHSPAQIFNAAVRTPRMPTQAWAWHPADSQSPANGALNGARVALGRVGGVTCAVGLAALPMLIFLLHGAREWTVLDGEGGGAGAVPFAARLVASVTVWWNGRTAMFGPAAGAVLIPAAGGIVICLGAWRRMSAATRCVCLAAWLVGPVYLVAFSAMVTDSPMRDRYGLFLVPIIAAFAGVGIDALLRRLSSRWTRRMGAATAVLASVAVLASPAAGMYAAFGTYNNPDWRGCAAFLADKVTPDDVVMVLADRPLGKTQPPFWGKIEWPAAERPLGEAAWTLATSPPHWQRLCKQRGSCYVVVMHEGSDQAAGEHHLQGPTAAPAGMTLRKFRRLDLLYRDEPAGGTPANVVAACDDLLQLPYTRREVRAIPLVLKARVLAEQGDRVHAQEAYAAALAHVPAERRTWFEKMTKMIATAAPRDD